MFLQGSDTAHFELIERHVQFNTSEVLGNSRREQDNPSRARRGSREVLKVSQLMHMTNCGRQVQFNQWQEVKEAQTFQLTIRKWPHHGCALCQSTLPVLLLIQLEHL